MCDLMFMKEDKSLEDVTGNVGDLSFREFVDGYGLHEGSAFKILHDHPHLVFDEMGAMQANNVGMHTTVSQETNFLECFALIFGRDVRHTLDGDIRVVRTRFAHVHFAISTIASFFVLRIHVESKNIELVSRNLVRGVELEVQQNWIPFGKTN